MYSNTRLKICTFVCHFFIVVGFAHSGATLGLLEIVGLRDWGEARFSFSLQAPFDNFLHSVALSSLLGQIAIILSITFRHDKVKKALHLSGLLMLWVSVAYLLGAQYKGEVQTSWLFLLPLLACTMWPFLRLVERPLSQINKWMDS